MNEAAKKRLDRAMRTGNVLIVEPNLAEQASYLRAHDFQPASEPEVSNVTGQIYQRWKRASRATRYKRRHRLAGLCQSCPEPAAIKPNGSLASRCAAHLLMVRKSTTKAATGGGQ